MSLYRKVDPSVWDDERFVDLGEDAQSIWMLLLTGPQTCSIAGLQIADALILASTRRWKVDRVETALAEIEAAGMAQVDRKFRVIRLPNGMKRNAPESVLVLRGLYRAWQLLPPSPLKWAHIESIESAIDFEGEKTGASMRHEWAVTFGKEAREKPNQTPSKPLRNPFEGDTQSPSNSVNSEQEQEQLKNLAPEKPARGYSKPKKPKAKSEPLPFTVEEGIDALAAAGRFVATPPTAGHKINAYPLVRKYGIGQWRLVGEWLASGAESYRKDLDSRALQNLPSWIVHAERWHADGRPPLAKQQGFRDVDLARPTPPISDGRMIYHDDEDTCLID